MTDPQGEARILPELNIERIEQIASTHENSKSWMTQRDGEEMCFHTLSTRRLKEFAEEVVREFLNTRTPAIADGVGVEVVGWLHDCVEGSSFHDNEEDAKKKQQDWGGYVHPLIKGTPPQAATDEG